MLLLILQKEDVVLELLIRYDIAKWPYIKEYWGQNNYQYEISQVDNGHDLYNDFSLKK